MNKNTLSIVKCVSIIIIAITSIILIFESFHLYQAKQVEIELNQKLQAKTKEYEQLEKYKENLYQNKQELTEKYFREDMFLIKNDEINIEFNVYA